MQAFYGVSVKIFTAVFLKARYYFAILLAGYCQERASDREMRTEEECRCLMVELLIQDIRTVQELLGQVQYPYRHFKLVNWLGTLSRKDMSDRLTRYIFNRRYQTVFMYDEDCASEIVSVLEEV